MVLRFLLQHSLSRSPARRPPIALSDRFLHSSASFATSSNSNSNSNSKDSNSSSNSNGTKSPVSHTSSQLLTLSTAKQLKGDIPEAISLANRALTQQRTENDPLAIADTSLFLGKLFQLVGLYNDAETSFEEAYSIHRDQSSSSTQQQQQQQSNTQKRSEYNALSHLAQAQKNLHRYNDAEQNYLLALSGLKSTVGWTDGATNHTSHSLARLYRERGQNQNAQTTLRSMKAGLVVAFGEGDSRAVQVNGELAEVSLLLGDRTEAIELLEEVVDGLPPNSPEARMAFVRVEELKEEEEDGVELGKGGVMVTVTEGVAAKER